MMIWSAMLEVFPSSSPFLNASPSRRRRLPSHCMSATERQRLVAAALRGGASKIQNKTKMENIDNICEGLYIFFILKGMLWVYAALDGADQCPPFTLEHRAQSRAVTKFEGVVILRNRPWSQAQWGWHTPRTPNTTHNRALQTTRTKH